MLLNILIFTPVAAAIAFLFVKKEKKVFIKYITFIAVPIEFIVMAKIVYTVAMTGTYFSSAYFYVDSLSAILLLIITMIGAAASVYSIGYLRTEVKKEIIGFSRVRQYFILMHLFIFTMLLAVSVSNPIMMWIAIEATTLSTAFLISFYNKPSSIEAAWKNLIINSVGLLLGFLGTLIFLAIFSSSLEGSETVGTWQEMLKLGAISDPVAVKVAFIFVLVGYGTKMGLVPMHTWLPDAHSKAPVPISALLSGVLLNVAFFAILRFKIVTDSAIGPQFSQGLLIFFGAMSIVLAALIILVQINYKRLLAYSSVEHMGIMALGFGFGGIGVFAALVHMIFHALTKSLLFFSAGNIFLKYSSTKISNVKGVITALPITGIIFMIGIMTITGMPPFGIFFTEFYILSSGVSSHPVVVSLVISGLVLVFVGFLKHATAMIFGEVPSGIKRGEMDPLTTAPIVIIVATLIGLGLFIPSQLIKLIADASKLFS